METKSRLLAALAAIALFAVVVAVPALAVHDDGIFQLDRNAVTTDPGDPATEGEDWDLVCPNDHVDGAAECLGGTTADTSQFIDDFPPNNATIFTGGGSKDDLDIDSGPWLWKNGSVPDKDNLRHGFAARYEDHLYFGADRVAANGDAALGVWFFQSAVTPAPGGGTQPFIGEHLDGDILVLTDFTGGGGTVTARVYQWNGPGGTIAGQGAINGTLDLIQGTDDPPSPADCVGPPQVEDNDNACATVNDEDEDSPWQYQAKEAGSPAGVFPPGHFFEGGIDLAGLDLDEECFSTFLIETRASTSVDSTLKDFVSGSFEQCGATITTNASDDADGAPFEIGDTITDTATVAVTGGGTPAPEGFVDFYLCGPSATVISSCDADGTFVSSEDLAGALESPDNSFSVTSNGVTLTAAGNYCFYAEYPPDQDSNYPDGAVLIDFTDECFSVRVNPTLTTTQTVTITDSATISANGGGNLLGTAHIQPFSDASCTAGNALAPDQALPVSGDSPETVTTTAMTILDPGIPTIYWKVSYDSDNPAQADIAATCTENSSIDIND